MKFLLPGFFCLTLFAAPVTNAQPPDSLWVQHYLGFSSVKDILPLDDGEAVICGSTECGYPDDDSFIAQVDCTGEFMWCYMSGYGPGNDGVNALCPSDNGYMASGTAWIPGGESDALIIDYSESWTLPWYETYDPLGWDETGTCMVERATGGWVVGGIYAGSMPGTDMAVFMTDQDGHFEQAFTYAISSYDNEVLGICQAQDGGYILSGVKGIAPTAGVMALLHISEAGSQLWQKTYGAGCLTRVQPAAGGGYYAVGGGSWYTDDGVVLRIGPDGTVLWQKTFGEVGEIEDFVLDEDGGIIAAAMPPDYDDKVFVFRVDSLGLMDWILSIDLHGYIASPAAIAETPDGGYLVGGRVTGPPHHAFLLKIGETTSGESFDSPIQNALRLCGCFPNPLSTNTVVSWEGVIAPARLAVFDLAGREVRSWDVGADPVGPGSLTWDGCSSDGRPLPDGVYVLRLTCGEVCDSRQVVILR